MKIHHWLQFRLTPLIWEGDWIRGSSFSYSYTAIALVVSLVLLVRLGVHLPTILRGFLFYIQIAPIAVAYFPDIFKVSNEVVRYSAEQ